MSTKTNTVTPESTPLPRPLRDARWLMARLGITSRGTISSMIARKQVPCIKLGRRAVRFDEDAIEFWIASRSVGTAK